MGNQIIDIKQMGLSFEILPEFCNFAFEVMTDAEFERLSKLGGILGLTKGVENTTPFQHSRVSEKQREYLKRIGFQKGQSGNPDGKPVGTQNLSTKLMRVLRKMKTKEGKNIQEEDFLRLGLIPLFENMVGKNSPRYHKLYNDMLTQIYGKPKETFDHKNDGGKFEPPIITGVRIVKEEE